MGSFALIRDFIRENKWKYAIGIIFILCVDILQLIFPKIIGAITDGFLNGTVNQHNLMMYLGLILLTAFGTAVFRYLFRVFIFGTEKKVEFQLRKTFFDHLLTLSTRFYNENKTGDLMAHATNDINAVRMAMGMGVLMITDTVFLTTTTLVIMISTIDIKLTLLALIPLPIIAIGSLQFGKVVHKRFTDVQEAFSGLTDLVQENFSGIRVIKAFVQEKEELKNFNKASQNAFDKNMKLTKLWALFGPMIQLVSTVSFIITIGYGGMQVILGNISLGDFMAFNIYLGMLIWPVLAFGWVVNIVQRAKASLDRLQNILVQTPDIKDENPLAIDDIKGEVEFKNLSFYYPNISEPALKDIDIHLYPGKTLAIIGGTGSGKTTLVNLIVRLYDAQEGQLLIDGIPIDRIPIKVLRKNIGYVPQDVFLFSSAIKDNIAFGVDDARFEDIENVSKVAQVYDNIMDFPDQFDTLVGERGVTLSGGQKQRVSIARALIIDPNILILDDALSAVDTQTEERILKELKRVRHNKTNIIISHRISTIYHADEIIVLDDGKIIERGNHESLLELNGQYAALYQKQLLEEQIQSI